MPIIKVNGVLLYFSHIPKCGGSSVENFLAQFSDSIVFLDRNFFTHKKTWNTSSPQHIDGLSLNRLFKDKNFFDYYFAIVRDPISRFKSAFMFQKHIEKKIPKDISINEHISLIKDEKISLFSYCDNHFLPMIHFFMPNTEYRIFKIEEGLENFKKWLEVNIYKKKINFEIPRENSSLKKIKQIEDYNLNEESIDNLKIIYKKDYEAFKY